MRKPTEALHAEADLQAIQTSVAFKNISDAVEQYRRQFGLAFLALIAFSAIHVGLVVIANLYTLETRVSNGKLSAASDSSTRPIPVATSRAEQVTDLSYIMSNLGEDDQRKLLSSMESIDFLDSAGDYRKYTVTGFQLGGYKRGDLKLFTAVGHVLTYIRGKGLVVEEAPDTTNASATSTPSKRKLLAMENSYAYTEFEAASGADFHTVTSCCDMAMVSHINSIANAQDQGTWSSTTDFQAAASLATALESCYSPIFQGLFDADSTTDVTYTAAGIQSYALHYLGELMSSLNDQTQGTSAQNICIVDMFGNVQENVYDDDGQGNMAYLSSGCQLGQIDTSLMSDSYFKSEEEPYAALEAFHSWTDCLKSVAKGVLYEYSVVAGGATDQASLNARASVCHEDSCSENGSGSAYLVCLRNCFASDNILSNSVTLAQSGVSSFNIGGNIVSLSDINSGFSSAGSSSGGGKGGGKGARKLLNIDLGLGVSCDTSKYGKYGEGDSVFHTGTGNGAVDSNGDSVDSLADYTNSKFQHDMCYLGVTVPDLIMLLLDENFADLLQNAHDVAWTGSTNSVSYNGVTWHMPDLMKNWDTVTGPDGTPMEDVWADLKALSDTVVDAAMKTIDEDVTDCVGRNAVSFMHAAKSLVSTASAYFGELSNVQDVIDYWVTRTESLEEEAYAFEAEMDNAILPKCYTEAYKCWFKHNKSAIQQQMNAQLNDALDEAKTWKSEGLTDPYAGIYGGRYAGWITRTRNQNAVTGSLTHSITLPSCDVPAMMLLTEDTLYGTSFESFLTTLGNGGTSETFDSTAASWGDDSWERCVYCMGTLNSRGQMYGSQYSQNTCPNMHILNALIDQMNMDWGHYMTAYSEGKAMLSAMRAEELEQVQSLKDQGWSHAQTQTFSLRVENVLADIALVHIPEIVSESIEIFNSFKSDNLWRGFKEVNMTNIDTSNMMANTWGCTGETLTHWQTYETKFGFVGYDACNVDSTDKYRKPFVSGAIFSEILAAYDPFSVYLSTTYCTGLMTAIDNGENPLFASSYDGWNSELLVMLHGFGGDHSFLHLSAATMFFMDRGTSRVNLGSEGQNESYDITTCSGSVQSSCVIMMAPGGFIVLAPDVSACPLSLRTWYTNSEFSGFVLDYILYEVPDFISGQLGTSLSRFGIFGFSMGGYGTMGALTTYPYMAGQASSFNAPVYPGGCFFFANCHQECAIDVVMCELEYTTTGMAINSYVLIFEDSMVLSMGAMDPMGAGVAKHMHAYGMTRPGSSYTTDVLECGNYEFASNTGKVESYYTKSSLAGMARECSWQNWGTSVTCEQLTGTNRNFLTNPNVFEPHPGSYKSVRMALLGYGSVTSTAFTCGNNQCREGTGTPRVPSLVDSTICSTYHCETVTWCSEYNMAEGAGAYLDPLKATISSAKFVPASVPTSGQFASLSSAGEAVASAYAKFAVSSPLLKFFFNNDMFASYTTLLYMHCSQNDEYDLFTPHATYAELLMSTFFTFSTDKRRNLLAAGDVSGTSDEHFNAASTMAVDFSDCDWHRYTESDLQKTMLVFSDNFRVYTNSLWAATSFATAGAADFKYCFLATYGFSPSWSVHDANADNPCPSGYMGRAEMNIIDNAPGIQSMYTKHEWDVAHSFNEVECDITALMLMIEELADLANSNTASGCTVSADEMSSTTLDFTLVDPTDSGSDPVCSASETIGAFSEAECSALCDACNAANTCLTDMPTVKTLQGCDHVYGFKCEAQV